MSKDLGFETIFLTFETVSFPPHIILKSHILEILAVMSELVSYFTIKILFFNSLYLFFASVMFIALIIISICSKYSDGILIIFMFPANNPAIKL